jgi:hypothetical protein
VSVSVFDDDILAVAVAKLAQPLSECRSVRLGRRCRFGREQDTDPRRYPRRLRLGGARRGEEAASDNAKERPPVHYSIT